MMFVQTVRSVKCASVEATALRENGRTDRDFVGGG